MGGTYIDDDVEVFEVESPPLPRTKPSLPTPEGTPILRDNATYEYASSEEDADDAGEKETLAATTRHTRPLDFATVDERLCQRRVRFADNESIESDVPFDEETTIPKDTSPPKGEVADESGSSDIDIEDLGHNTALATATPHKQPLDLTIVDERLHQQKAQFADDKSIKPYQSPYKAIISPKYMVVRRDEATDENADSGVDTGHIGDTTTLAAPTHHKRPFDPETVDENYERLPKKRVRFADDDSVKATIPPEEATNLGQRTRKYISPYAAMVSPRPSSDIQPPIADTTPPNPFRRSPISTNLMSIENILSPVIEHTLSPEQGLERSRGGVQSRAPVLQNQSPGASQNLHPEDIQDQKTVEQTWQLFLELKRVLDACTPDALARVRVALRALKKAQLARIASLRASFADIVRAGGRRPSEREDSLPPDVLKAFGVEHEAIRQEEAQMSSFGYQWHTKHRAMDRVLLGLFESIQKSVGDRIWSQAEEACWMAFWEGLGIE